MKTMIVPFYIDKCEFGKITVNGNTYTSDIIVTRSEIISDWWRKESHLLTLEDIEMLEWDNVHSVFIGT